MTYGFTTQAPRLRHLAVSSGRLALPLDDVVWIGPDGKLHRLPRGMPSDGVSFPGVARLIGMDPWGICLREALLHDAGYTLQDWPDIFGFGSKREVDTRFRLGVGIDQPKNEWLFYKAVHVFGGPSWRKPNAPHVDEWVEAVRSGRPEAVDAFIDKMTKKYAQLVIAPHPAVGQQEVVSQ